MDAKTPIEPEATSAADTEADSEPTVEQIMFAWNCPREEAEGILARMTDESPGCLHDSDKHASH